MKIKKAEILCFILFTLKLSVALVHLISFLESVNAAACIHKLLLARKERVARRTNFYLDAVLFRRPGFECIAAGTLHRNGLIIRMNALFHLYHLVQRILYSCVSLAIIAIIIKNSKCFFIYLRIFLKLNSGIPHSYRFST